MIREISAEQTHLLRHQILRPHQAPDTLVYPGDNATESMHYGAFQDKRMVGIISLYRQETRQFPEEKRAWQIRGMATLPQVRGQGYGGKLLEHGLSYCAQQQGRLVWCNARCHAVGFYQHFGFEPLGDEFIIAEVGPHFFMWRSL